MSWPGKIGAFSIKRMFAGWNHDRDNTIIGRSFATGFVIGKIRRQAANGTAIKLDVDFPLRHTVCGIDSDYRCIIEMTGLRVELRGFTRELKRRKGLGIQFIGSRLHLTRHFNDGTNTASVE
jgi:hypothetical protein